MTVTDARVLLVVPTLGRRPDYLRQTLASIRAQDVAADIVVVTPADATVARELASHYACDVLDDPGSLSTAVNLGVATAADRHAYVNWLGDDDLLAPGSLARTAAALDADPGAVVAYGHCVYVDPEGRTLWVSRAGRVAPWLMTWGPDLVPQPGMLVRRDAWARAGGLDASLRFAMDLDLLLRLRNEGRFVDVGVPVSAFRWHPDSLTVSDRSASLDESEAVKRRYLSRWQRAVAPVWELPVRGATRLAARRVTRRAHAVARAATGEVSP